MVSPTTAALSAMEMGFSSVNGNPSADEAREPTQHKISYWDDLDSKVITVYQIFCTVIVVGAIVVFVEGSILKDPYTLTASITALGLSSGGFIFAGRVRRLKVVADLGRRVDELEGQISELDRIKNEQETNFNSQINVLREEISELDRIKNEQETNFNSQISVLHEQINKISDTGLKLAVHVTVLKKLNKGLESDLKTFNIENDELKASNDELQQSLGILNESIVKLSGVGTQHLKRQEALLEREEDATEHLEEVEQKIAKLLHLTELVKIIKELNPAIINQAQEKLGFELAV